MVTKMAKLISQLQPDSNNDTSAARGINKKFAPGLPDRRLTLGENVLAGSVRAKPFGKILTPSQNSEVI